MVKHIILWDFAEGLSEEEKDAHALDIAEGLSGLKAEIPGIVSLDVYRDLIPSSNVELVLDSAFESAEALAVYTDHPAHVKVATERVRPFIQNRRVADFEV
jgi:hypothetical protein